MQHLYAVFNVYFLFQACKVSSQTALPLFFHTYPPVMFAYQFRLRNALPHVLGHKDYRIKAQLYKTIDDILMRSKLDDLFIEHALKNRDALRKEMLADKLTCDPKELDGFDLSADDFMRARFIEHSLVACRCNIIRFLLDVWKLIAGLPHWTTC
jgi:hypothetical protein